MNANLTMLLVLVAWHSTNGLAWTLPIQDKAAALSKGVVVTPPKAKEIQVTLSAAEVLEVPFLNEYHIYEPFLEFSDKALVGTDKALVAIQQKESFSAFMLCREFDFGEPLRVLEQKPLNSFGYTHHYIMSGSAYFDEADHYFMRADVSRELSFRKLICRKKVEKPEADSSLRN